MTAEGGRSTVDVESAMTSEGKPVVTLLVTMLVDQDRRWFKPRPPVELTKPVELTSTQARKLAHQLLEASGVHYATVLDEELAQLQEAASSTTSVEDYETLVMLRNMVKIMRRMFLEPVDG